MQSLFCSSDSQSPFPKPSRRRKQASSFRARPLTESSSGFPACAAAEHSGHRLYLTDRLRRRRLSEGPRGDNTGTPEPAGTQPLTAAGAHGRPPRHQPPTCRRPRPARPVARRPAHAQLRPLRRGGPHPARAFPSWGCGRSPGGAHARAAARPARERSPRPRAAGGG